MHKRSAASTMRHPEHASRLSDRGQRNARYAVIRWRLARDNQGRERPTRDVRTFPSQTGALLQRDAWEDALQTIFIAVIDRTGAKVYAEGEPSIVDSWRDERRGVNRGADPFTASAYMTRERRDGRAWVDARHGLPDWD